MNWNELISLAMTLENHNVGVKVLHSSLHIEIKDEVFNLDSPELQRKLTSIRNVLQLEGKL